ncbi:dolichyl-phosphate mannosyltransferase subunit 3 isoform X2 [Ptiloglossa arizonensis]
MTKLMEWLLFATMFFGVWVAVIMGKIYSTLTAEWQQVILFFPLIAVFLFSAYAAITILCRVFIFNNCKNAAVELQQQIEEAKKDLQNNGINLKIKSA